WFDKLWKSCAFGYPGVQDVLLLTDPSNENGYYLFQKPNIYNAPNPTTIAMYYSYIDQSLDNSNGVVIKKNIKYYPDEKMLRYYFTAIKHENKKDWWLIQPLVDDSTFISFLVNENGINLQPNQNTHQYFDRSRSSASGTARFSPDGTKYAIYNYYDQLHVYDFDRATGILSNHQKIEIYPPNEIDRTRIVFSSVEWSPNSRFIYCSSEYKLHQVDIWASNPQNNIQLVGEYDGTEDPLPTLFCFMVQGPDCRIYMTPKSSSWTIHVINKPNELGKACDFVQNSIRLQYPTGGTLPNFPRFRVDEVDKCDPTITSMLGELVYYRKNLVVYPNPSTGLFTIKIPESIDRANLVVSNINGQIIYKKEIRHSIIEDVDITNYPSGRYNIDVYPVVNDEMVYYGKQVVKL
ncbi:MAG TPA: T9SS type A sorting domain-containing protein, partial [Saprospiraceae bacterium]|nr:T9SS type A sorting domain-containing protein [Saprospiraceae bacterium]